MALNMASRCRGAIRNRRLGGVSGSSAEGALDRPPAREDLGRGSLSPRRTTGMVRSRKATLSMSGSRS